MKEPSEHDQKEPGILRMSDVAIHTIRNQTLGLVNSSPAQENKYHSRKGDPGSGDHPKTTEHFTTERKDERIIKEWREDIDHKRKAEHLSEKSDEKSEKRTL